MKIYYYICYNLGDHNSLRRHKLRHSKDRPYKCSHCDYNCIQVTALKSHITNNHQDKMDNSYYSCNRCTFGTVSLKRFNDHITGHETQVQNGIESKILINIIYCNIIMTYFIRSRT